MLGPVCIVLLGSFGITCNAAASDVTTVLDWVSLTSTLRIVPSPSTGYISSFGVFRHVTSGKYVHTGVLCPGDRTNLRIGTTSFAREHEFRFSQQSGHLGYFEHSCQKLIHPKGGSISPGDRTNVVVHSDRHTGAYFSYNERDQRVEHIGGKIWHPSGGNANPSEGTSIVVHKDLHGNARFTFTQLNGAKSIYPDPEVSGHWEILYAVADPVAVHSYSIQYKVGQSMIQQANEINSWKVKASSSFDWFKTSSQFNDHACHSDAATWESESVAEFALEVSPSKTTVVWQWIFEAEQFGEIMRFRSSILGETDDVHTVPSVLLDNLPNAC